MCRNSVARAAIVLVAVLALPGRCEQLKIGGQAQLRAVCQKLHNRDINRVEILWMDPVAETRATVTPGVLEMLYFRKLEIRKIAGSKIGTSLAEALKATSLSGTDSIAEGDVRWAIKFYGRAHSELVASIYLDGEGRTGFISGTPYSFDKSLLAWLESNFATTFPSRSKQ